MSDYSDVDTDYDYSDMWNPFGDDEYDDYLFYGGYNDSYDDIDYDDQSDSDTLDELAEYMNHLSSGLRKLQSQNTFCDVTLKVGGKSFQAHKAVLASSSDYFMAMFTSGFQEAGTAEVTIEGDSAIFEKLLEFAYTGVITDLTPENVADVMSMGGYLQFTHTLKMCKSFVTRKYGWDEKAISLQDAFEISLLAESYGLELSELVKRSKTYMTDYFFYLAKKDNFAEQTTIECLEKCLDSCIPKPAGQKLDDECLTVITIWLKHNWNERKIYTLNLLKKIRLGLVSTDELKKLRESSEMQELPECLIVVDEVLQLKMIKTPEWLTDIPLYMSHPALFAKRSTSQSLVAIGTIQHQNRAIKLNGTYMAWASCERDISPLPNRICNSGCISVNGHLMVAGGIYQKGQINKTNRNNVILLGKIHAKAYWYDAVNKRWNPLTHMKRARKSPAMVHMDGFVYALGGIGKSGPLRHVECYSLANKTWYHISQLPLMLNDLSAVVFNEKLLVYGCRTDVKDTYGLLMYSTKPSVGASSGAPVNGSWFLLRTDKHFNALSGIYKPCLTVQDGKCYRVLYGLGSEAERNKPNVKNIKVKVNEIVCDFVAKVPSATVGPEEAQHEELMSHVIGTVTFCINESLFVNACGLVYRVVPTVAETSHKESGANSVWIMGNTDDILGASVVLHTYEESSMI